MDSHHTCQWLQKFKKWLTAPPGKGKTYKRKQDSVEFSIILACEGEMSDSKKEQTTQTIRSFFKEEKLSDSLDIIYSKDQNSQTVVEITTVNDAKQAVKITYDEIRDKIHNKEVPVGFENCMIEAGVYAENIAVVARALCSELQNLQNSISYSVGYYESSNSSTALLKRHCEKQCDIILC